MNGYYDETLQEIRDLIDRKEYAEAEMIVRKELSMPYVPPDFEESLKAIRKDLAYLRSETSVRKEADMDTLLNELKGDSVSQLRAASVLSEKNLRKYAEELREYLMNDPQPEAAALVIEAIAEQEVPEEFTYVKDGVEYTFWGDSLTPISESSGYHEAFRILKETLENEHPDYLEMCRTLLVREVFMFLPLSYDTEDGEALADEILKNVSDMMDGGDLYRYLRNSQISTL